MTYLYESHHNRNPNKGLYGFDSRGPSSFRIHYWANVLQILRDTLGAEVIVTSVPRYVTSCPYRRMFGCSFKWQHWLYLFAV